MALQFRTIPEYNLGGGIDARSSENQIGEGFAEDLLNIDLTEERIAKRNGYERYYGCFPIRVESVSTNQTTNQLTFTFPQAIDVTNLRSSPILVRGRAEIGSWGDFNSSTIESRYYDTYDVGLRKTASPSDSTPITISSTDHALNTDNLFLGTIQSTSVFNSNATDIMFGGERINTSNNNIELDYSVSEDVTYYTFYKDVTTLAGETYTKAVTSIPGNFLSSPLNGTTTITISASEHNLNNFNIIAQLYEVDTAGNLKRKIIPDSLSIDAAGQVTIELELDVDVDDIIVSLASSLAANSATAEAPSGQTTSLTFNVDNPFYFYSLYEVDNINNTASLIQPDSASYNSTTGTYTISVTNNTGSNISLEAYYTEGVLTTNTITVDTLDLVPPSTDETDTSPLLDVYGLCHENVYSDSTLSRPGWVHHIDSYRRVGEDRVVGGLGGVLYRAVDNSETSDMPTRFGNLRGRVDGDTVTGPTFWKTSQVPGRTRGYITHDNGGGNLAEITSAEHISGNIVRYAINVPNVKFFDSSDVEQTASTAELKNIINTTGVLSDKLQVSRMGFSRHNGTFDIVDAAYVDANTITIDVTNPNIPNDDYDEQEAGGQAGIFTDTLPFTTTSLFLPDDVLQSSFISSDKLYTVVASLGTDILITGAVDKLTFPNGLLLGGKRSNSRVITLRDETDSTNIENIVAGDTLEYTSLQYKLQVDSINNLSDVNVTIAGDGSTATVTLGSEDTSSFNEGDVILIVDSESYSGEQTIESITSSTEFTFSSTSTASESAVLEGKTINVDTPLEWEDNLFNLTAFNVQGRWQSIEAPSTVYSQTPAAKTFTFDSNTYTSQPYLRSTMFNDNLYFTNGEDEVYKFDGVNTYRAGLPRWQPQVFVTKDTGASTTISDLEEVSKTVTGKAGSIFELGSGDEEVFQPGDRIEHSADGAFYTVKSVSNDGTNGLIEITGRSISGAGSGTITRLNTFRYYYRLNLIDANSNTIGSAVANSQDAIVEVGSTATAIHHRIIGLPPIDVYDFDKLEVEIYRTAQNGVAPYRRVANLDVEYNGATTYIDFTDSVNDSTLANNTLDTFATTLLGAELPTQIEEPRRAKYITSAGNRLLYANLRDYQKLDIQFINNSSSGTDFSNFVGETITLKRGAAASAESITYEFGTKTEFTAYDISGTNRGNITQSSGTVTIPYTKPGAEPDLAEGDVVYIYHDATAGDINTALTGWHIAQAGTDGSELVINDASGSARIADATIDKIVVASTTSNYPVLLDNADNNYQTAEEGLDNLLNVGRRLANAINASFVVRNAAGTRPWATAQAGGSFSAGQILLEKPVAEDAVMEIETSAFASDTPLALFVNGARINLTSAATSSATVQTFPSRVIASFVNYPETFDATTVLNTRQDSLSAIDVNPEDGQEITGIIPFFSQAAFEAAQKTDQVIVFKENSIYLVNLRAKEAGEDPVRKLETQGLGCEAPGSITVTKLGIMFANRSGIYRLTQSLTIEYLGQLIERQWLDRVNRDELETMQATHDGIRRRYKVSVPIGDTATSNSEVLVYHHTSENADMERRGGWTRYDNHNATGWANLNSDAFFATDNGYINILKRTRTEFDFRDVNEAITSEALLRAMSFGNSGIRKVVGDIVSHFRTNQQINSTFIEFAEDLSNNFTDTDEFELDIDETVDNLSDLQSSRKVISLKTVMGRRRCIYMQFKYVNNGIDEAFELAGIDISVAPLSGKGILEAKATKE